MREGWATPRCPLEAHKVCGMPVLEQQPQTQGACLGGSQRVLSSILLQPLPSQQHIRQPLALQAWVHPPHRCTNAQVQAPAGQAGGAVTSRGALTRMSSPAQRRGPGRAGSAAPPARRGGPAGGGRRAGTPGSSSEEVHGLACLQSGFFCKALLSHTHTHTHTDQHHCCRDHTKLSPLSP